MQILLSQTQLDWVVAPQPKLDLLPACIFKLLYALRRRGRLLIGTALHVLIFVAKRQNGPQDATAGPIHDVVGVFLLKQELLAKHFVVFVLVVAFLKRVQTFEDIGLLSL